MSLSRLCGQRLTPITTTGLATHIRLAVSCRAYDVRPQAREDWIAIPFHDAGIPPQCVLKARERIRANTRFQPSTDPRLKLRGFIKSSVGAR